MLQVALAAVQCIAVASERNTSAVHAAGESTSQAAPSTSNAPTPANGSVHSTNTSRGDGATFPLWSKSAVLNSYLRSLDCPLATTAETSPAGAPTDGVGYGVPIDVRCADGRRAHNVRAENGQPLANIPVPSAADRLVRVAARLADRPKEDSGLRC